MHVFAQQMRSCDIQDFQPCATPRTRVVRGDVQNDENYKSVHRPGGTAIQSYHNKRRILRSTFNPIAVWQGAWQGQFFGETKGVRNDVPGTDTNRAHFFDLTRITNNGNNTIQNINLNAGNPDRYHHIRSDPNNPNQENFRIWTDPLNRL